jgi:hypothetical protein
MNRAAAIASRFFQPMEVALVVFLGEEARLAIDSALNDVQRVVGQKNSCAAWHVRYSESQMSLTPLIPILVSCASPANERLSRLLLVPSKAAK